MVEFVKTERREEGRRNGCRGGKISNAPLSSSYLVYRVGRREGERPKNRREKERWGEERMAREMCGGNKKE